MKLYAKIISMNVDSSVSITLGVSYGYATTPSPTNSSVYFSITPPNILTDLTLTQAAADGLVTAVNAQDSKSFSRTDVIFVDGGIHLVTL
jgi:hypothetical protein